VHDHERSALTFDFDGQRYSSQLRCIESEAHGATRVEGVAFAGTGD
jgi:hypothetical protein